MRVDHHHRPGKNARGHKVRRAALIHRAVQHIEQREQHRPAEKRRALRQHHVHDHVDPADILLDKVRRRLVKRRENPREIRTVLTEIRQKVRDAEAAVQKKQRHRESGLCPAAQKTAEKQPRAEKDLRRREQHRQEIRELQGRAEQIEARGNAVGKERIRELHAGQNRIHRRERPLLRDARDEAEVHAHVTVGALARPDLAVLNPEAVQQKPSKNEPEQRGHEQPPFFFDKGRRKPPRHAQRGAPPPERERRHKQQERERQKMRPNRKAKRKRPERRQPHQKHAAGRTAEHRADVPPLRFEKARGKQHAACLKGQKIQQRQNAAEKITVHRNLR